MAQSVNWPSNKLKNLNVSSRNKLRNCCDGVYCHLTAREAKTSGCLRLIGQ